MTPQNSVCVNPLFLYIVWLFVLQWVLGNIRPEWFAFPLNGALWLAGLVLVGVAVREKPASAFVRFLRSPRLACGLCAALVGVCTIGGFTPQHPSHEETDPVSWWTRLGWHQFSTSWQLVGLLTIVLLQLAVIVCLRLRQPQPWKRNGAFLWTHAGCFLALSAGMAGSADVSCLRTVVDAAHDQRIAYREDGAGKVLPFTLRLLDFRVERTASDHSVCQYAARVAVNGHPEQLAVNAPHAVDFFTDLYLVSYDPEFETATPASPHSGYVVLQVVRQPWKWLQLSGFILWAIGGIALLTKAKPSVPLSPEGKSARN